MKNIINNISYYCSQYFTAQHITNSQTEMKHELKHNSKYKIKCNGENSYDMAHVCEDTNVIENYMDYDIKMIVHEHCDHSYPCKHIVEYYENNKLKMQIMTSTEICTKLFENNLQSKINYALLHHFIDNNTKILFRKQIINHRQHVLSHNKSHIKIIADGYFIKNLNIQMNINKTNSHTVLLKEHDTIISDNKHKHILQKKYIFDDSIKNINRICINTNINYKSISKIMHSNKNYELNSISLCINNYYIGVQSNNNNIIFLPNYTIMSKKYCCVKEHDINNDNNNDSNNDNYSNIYIKKNDIEDIFFLLEYHISDDDMFTKVIDNTLLTVYEYDNCNNNMDHKITSHENMICDTCYPTWLTSRITENETEGDKIFITLDGVNKNRCLLDMTIITKCIQYDDIEHISYHCGYKTVYDNLLNITKITEDGFILIFKELPDESLYMSIDNYFTIKLKHTNVLNINAYSTVVYIIKS